VANASVNGNRVFRQIGGADLAGPGRPSPDGRLLSIVLQGELGLHEVATGKSWKLTGDQSGDPPGYVEHSQFSLDGSRLTYLRFVQQPNPNDPAIPEIRRIAANGGRSRLLWRGEDARYVNFYHWAGEDDLILVSRWPDQGRGELLLIDTTVGQVRATHTLPTAPSLTGASLSPDGRYVAFEQVDRSTGYRDIDMWEVATDAVFPLIRDTANDGSPVWTPDGSHVLFLSNRSGSNGLWAQRIHDGRAAGPPSRLDPNVDAGAPMGGLTDTGSLFMRRQIGTRDVFVVDVHPVTLSPLGEPRRVTGQPRSATGTSAWSPDGNYLAFFRRDDERRSLVVHSMRDGREREYWRPDVGGLILPRWEPGGRSILFKGGVDGIQGLHRLDLASGSITTVLKRSFTEYEPLPVPGVVVLSDRGKREIVRVDLETGREDVIHRLPPPSTLVDMGLSHSGDRLAYSSPFGGNKGAAVRVLDLNVPIQSREIFRTPPGTGIWAYAWSADDREVIVGRNVNAGGAKDGKDHLWAIDVETGKSRPIGLTVDRGLQKLQSSPDGRRLSYDVGFPYQEVWVLENVAALLPQ
jgi:Tol biopolymer transport system component